MMNQNNQRRLNWNACYNARDLGGYSTTKGQEIRWGALVRSDNLDQLTAVGQAALVAYGVKTIIDVRSVYEATNWPHAFMRHDTIHYVNAPLGDVADDPIKSMLDSTETVLEWSCRSLDYAPEQVGIITRSLAQAPPGGIVVHCHSGKDRTGMVVALLLALVGVPYETIIDDYAISAEYLQPVYSEWLQKVAHDPVQHENMAKKLTSYPETMGAILAHIDTNYGSVAAYLHRAGVTETEMNQIHGRLCITPSAAPAPASASAQRPAD